MKHLIQNKPQCMLYSIAMITDTTVEDVISFIGHDGLKGVHIQELQAFAFSRGYALVCYEPEPCLEGKGVVDVESFNSEPYLQYRGLMLGRNSNGNNHCVAWDGSIIFDPKMPSSFVDYHQFWALVKR